MFSIKPIIKRPFTMKLALMYIASKYPKTIPEEILSEIAVGECEMNFFFFRQALFELCQIGYFRTHIENKTKYFSLTSKGEQALEQLQERLGNMLRVMLTDYVKAASEREDKMAEYTCNIVPVGDIEYDVACIYKESRDILYNLTFRAGTKEEATKIAKILSKKGDVIYEKIYASVMKMVEDEKEQQA